MASRYSFRDFHGPSIFPRDWHAQDISTDDFEHPQGFAARAGGAGTVTYISLDGGATTQTQAVVAGDYIGPDKRAPALLKKVEANSDVSTITVIYYAR